MTDEQVLRIAQLEASVSSLARAPQPQAQVTIRQSAQALNPTMQVGWLATKEAITTSAAATGGFVAYRFINVPSDATAVIIEAYGATAALGGQPTVTVKWKAETNTAEILALKFKASAISGDASGNAGLILPVSGGACLYEVSADWSEVELHAIGFLSPRLP